jgi:hypothetical protein
VDDGKSPAWWPGFLFSLLFLFYQIGWNSPAGEFCLFCVGCEDWGLTGLDVENWAA